MCAKWLQSYQTLCDPMDCSSLGSSLHGIFQARILKGVDISFWRDLPERGIEPACLMLPPLAGVFFTTCTTLFSIATTSFYSHTVRFPFIPHIITSACYLFLWLSFQKVRGVSSLQFLELHFSNNWWYWTPFDYPLWKIAIQIFCPFLTGFLWLLLTCMSALYILTINPLSYSFLKLFSPIL